MTVHGPQDGLCPWHTVVKKSFLFFLILIESIKPNNWRLWGNQVALAELDLIFAVSTDLSRIPPVGVVWDQGLNGFIRVRCSIPACREWKNNFMELGKPGKNWDQICQKWCLEYRWNHKKNMIKQQCVEESKLFSYNSLGWAVWKGVFASIRSLRASLAHPILEPLLPQAVVSGAFPRGRADTGPWQGSYMMETINNRYPSPCSAFQGMLSVPPVGDRCSVPCSGVLETTRSSWQIRNRIPATSLCSCFAFCLLELYL